MQLSEQIVTTLKLTELCFGKVVEVFAFVCYCDSDKIPTEQMRSKHSSPAGGLRKEAGAEDGDCCWLVTTILYRSISWWAITLLGPHLVLRRQESWV